MLPRLFGAVLAAVMVAVLPAVSSHAAVADVARERVIVQVQGSDPGAVSAEVARRYGGRVSHVYRHAVSGFAVELPAPAVSALRADPRVVTVEPTIAVRAVGEVPTGIARGAITSSAVADIDGSDDSRVDVDIAILDTGIDSTHPDLHVRGGADCTVGVCVDVLAPLDENGHGTHVAGTAAALDDGAGVVGAAPGARLWSVKVLDAQGSGSSDTVLAGLDWLAANADTVEVANVSLGCDSSQGSCSSTVLDDAVTAVADRGVVIAAAAGNASEDIDGFAITAHPEVITVSAMADLDGAPGAQASGTCHGNVDDTFATFSSYGDAVDLAAPGVCIVSTWPVLLGSYAVSSGTSMASPHVAGVAGLYIVQHGVLRSADRPGIVRNGIVDDWSVAQTGACGFGGGVTPEPMLYLTYCPLSTSSDQAPSVTITEPSDGTYVTVGEPLAFTGTASDTEDGALTSKIAWSSDRDGALGTGGTISVGLSEGTHVVTAEVQDSGGAEATDTVEVHVDPQPSIARLAGADRVATGVAVSREVFAGGAPAAVVAYGGDFPDALAATPLASAVGGPVLLNVRDRLHADVGAELDRLGAETVYVMGGTAVQTAQVDEDLRGRGMHPVRVQGSDRWATAAEAAAMADRIWRDAGAAGSSQAVLALGSDFPDALSGGVLAATRRGPLLLTGRDVLPGPTSQALHDLGTRSVTIMGGTAAVSSSVASELESAGYTVTRVAGQDRFATAVAAADAAVRIGAEYRSVLIASGRSFPDALSGGPAVVSRDGVLLLSERDDLPDPSSQALSTAADVHWVRLAGGSAVLTDAVLDEAATASGIPQ